MRALDQCHERVVRALLGDGWTINRQPFRMVTPLNPLFIDLEVSRPVAADQQTVLLIEIKCFPDGESTMNDLCSAIGQYFGLSHCSKGVCSCA